MIDTSRQLSLTGEPAQTLDGAVERVLHRNEETGWGVLLFDLEDAGRVKAVGNFLGVQPGEVLGLAGELVEHPKFGR